MERSLKVFAACFLGAGIGALVALQMGPWLWWIGAGIGFLVGYLSYEFEAVRQAFTKAWRVATVKRELDFGLIALAVRLFWLYFSVGLTGGIAFYLFMGLPLLFVDHPDRLAHQQLVMVGGTGVALLIGVVFSSGTLHYRGSSTADELLEEAREFSTWINPLRVYFLVLPSVAVKGIRWLLSIAWEILYTAFRTIHSEVRLLCGVDAAIGAVIGYFLGNAILGATIGGVLGVVNYELISRRLLRLVP